MSSKIKLGTNVATGKEILLPRSLWGQQVIRGMTGSGKTSLGIIPSVDQFMQPYPTKFGIERDPIAIFDLGGDQNLFHNAWELATKYGRTFRYLMLDKSVLEVNSF